MSKKPKVEILRWKVHTVRLFEEILLNPGASALVQPLRILLSLLHEVAVRASEIDDEKLNQLMLRLTLYEIADPLSDSYNPGKVRELLHEQPRTGNKSAQT